MRTILIIDDEKEFRKKYKKLLKEKGFTVIEAENALDVGNSLMRDHSKIDLILLDINIPEVDGRGIWEIIDEYAPELPIIVTSVHPIVDQKLKVPRCADYFSKLHKEDLLLSKIMKVLGMSESEVVK